MNHIEDICFLKSGKLRLKVLRLIQNCNGFPVSTIDVTDILDNDISQSSSIIKELEERKLVYNVSKGKRNKQFILTDKGEEILLSFKEFDKNKKEMSD